jgi:hypothetical protein
MLRTYALWNNNRIILVVMLFTLFAVVVATIVDHVTVDASYVTISAIPGIRGCYQTSADRIYIMFILLLGFQLGLVSLTIIRAIQRWRVVNGPLYDILVKHNVVYYACAMLLTVVNVLTQKLFSQSAYRFVCEILQLFVLAILATRMHLSLWQIDRRTHGSGSDALVDIYMSDIQFAECTVTTV